MGVCAAATHRPAVRRTALGCTGGGNTLQCFAEADGRLVAHGAVAGPAPGPVRPGKELELPCPVIEDDVQMMRAYESIARKRVEYAPRYTACLEEVVRLHQLRRYIFRQSRALAQQMLTESGAYLDDEVLGEDCEGGGMGQAAPCDAVPQPGDGGWR